MDDFKIDFVPKSQRTKKESKPLVFNQVSSVKSKDTRAVLVPSILNEDQKKVIHEHYTADKDKSTRNYTLPFSEQWSYREDTTLRTYAKNEFEFNEPNKREHLEDEFSRPSRRKTSNAKRNVDESKMSNRDIRLWRCSNDVVITANERVDIPPMLEWNQLLNKDLVNSLVQCKFYKPMVVQSSCIPLSLNGKDVIGLSQPGTGKTLAYLVPLIEIVLRTLNENNGQFDPTGGPLGIVLAPTHELAEQINDIARNICLPLGLNSFALTGGFSINDQALTLNHGYHIIVATPGRLNDVINGHLMVVGNCKFIVLDEADKMIDKSFSSDIENIIASASPDKRLLMFSATMPSGVMAIIENFFKKVVTVKVGKIGDASENIKQIAYYTSKLERDKLFVEKMYGLAKPILVFANTRDSCEIAANLLNDGGFRVAFIHGGKSQKERDSIVDSLKDGIFDIIVATDVLSRGIDIGTIQNVVNYEVPTDISVYVHRIGRTGRSGQKGTSISYITPEDKEIMYDLTKLLQRNHFTVPEGMLKNPYSQTRYKSDNQDINLNF